MTLTIRRATPADIDAVLGLVTDAARWLAERGSDQWQYPTERHRLAIERATARGEVWVVYDDTGAIIATVTLNAYADPEFWTPDDDPADAFYVHRMAVARTASGQEVGSALLDWAGRQSVDAGKKWLRLDAWANNTALQDYYRQRSFQSVRLLSFGHRGSGALFQRSATTQLGTGPRLIEDAALRR
jgi:ribosomal protein S18 acetylase RimI-like enzyme